MLEFDIQELLKSGWWVSVSPVNSGGEWKFTCGIYKNYKKSGNWVTDNCKSFPDPQQCYDWAINYLKKQKQNGRRNKTISKGICT